MSSASISATSTRHFENTWSLGLYFVSCRVEQSPRGFVCTGAVARSESAFGNGDQLPRISVGPLPSANSAQTTLLSHVRWAIGNRSWPFSCLA